MNKNQYRIIFSKAKNMFIAVAENVKSNTKTAGQTKSNTEHREVVDQSFHQMWQVKSLVFSMSLFMSIAPVYAQMQADPAAAAAQQASIGVGQNQQGQNVPVVNIQTPKNGVSHNVYNQFDVLQSGVVLNNSRGGAGSVIVGQVGANPYLQTGEARVILNEVNSPTASRFEGNLEVAGQRADVIIANPSGINIQGGGFINANKAIFTTGKTQLNEDGSIKQFVVDQGKVNVNSNGDNLGLGGNGNNADYVDIYAKAIELNAQAHANQALQAITGSNTISEDLTTITPKQGNTPTTAFALDVKALGGMYANNIYIVGTDKGLGVNNAGTIQAPQNIVITNDGRIQNLSTIKTTNPENGLISLSTNTGADILSTGLIQSNGNIFLDSGQNLSIDKGQLIKENNTSEGIISVSAKGAVNFKNNAQVQNNIGGIYVDGRNVNINQGAVVASNNDVNLNATNSVNIQNSPVVYGKNGLNIVSENKSEIANSTLATAESNNININDLNKGRVYPIAITGEPGTTLKVLDAEKNIIATALMDSDGKARVDVRTNSPVIFANLTDAAGNVSPDSRLDIGTVQPNMLLTNVNFQMNRFDSAGTGSVNISSNDAISLNQVSVNNNGVGAVNLQAQGDVKWLNTSASPIVTGKLNLRSNGKLDVTGTKITANDGLNLLGKEIVIDTELRSNKDLNLTATENDLNLNLGTNLSSAGDINVSALKGNLNTSNLQAKSEAGGISLTAFGDTNISRFKSNFDFPNVQPKIASSIDAKNGVVIGSIGTGTTNVDLAYINSVDSGVKIQSDKGINLTNSQLNAKGNVELFAKDDLLVKGTSSTSQAHTALHADRNIILDESIYKDKEIAMSFGGDKFNPIYTRLNTSGVLSLTSNLDQNIINSNLVGGAILIESGGSFNLNQSDAKPSQSFLINATGSDLLKNDVNLQKIDGKLSINTKSDLTLNAIDNYGKTFEGLNEKYYIGPGDGYGYEFYQNMYENYDKYLKPVLLSSGLMEIKTDGNLTLNGRIPPVNNNKYQQLMVDPAALKSAGGINLNAKSINLNTALLVNTSAENAINLISTSGDISINAMKQDEINQRQYDLMNPIQNYRDILIASGKTDTVTKNLIESLDKEVGFYLADLNGSRHIGTKIDSNSDINLTSKSGVLLRSAELQSKGNVNIEAQGLLNRSLTATNPEDQIDAAVVIDGTVNLFKRGLESDPNYMERSLVSSTLINADKDINISSTGNSGDIIWTDNPQLNRDYTQAELKPIELKRVLNNAKDNVVINAADLISKGNINIKSNGNIIMESAVEESYDKFTTKYIKESWAGLKKTTKVVREQTQLATAIPTILTANNVNLQARGDVELYSTLMKANGGKVDITGENLYFFTSKELDKYDRDSKSTSSLLGIKYDTTKVNTNRTSVSQLPVKLQGDYLSTDSNQDTVFVGTQFDYLKDATIKANGDIALLGASNIIEESKTLEKNSVVWQKMEGEGSTTQTMMLPSFNGPTPPTFKAGGGIDVQIPIGEQDQNKVQLKDEIIKLSNQPGYEYLKEFTQRDNVDWNKVILTQKEWDYSQQGLTGPGAALIVIIVTVLTSGAGTAAASAVGGGAVGAGAQAAVATLASQASVSLINNGGDVAATLKDLGSKDSVKGLVTSVVTAGLLNQVGTVLNLKPDSALLSDRIINNFTNSVGSTLVHTAINGGDIGNNIEQALLSGLAGVLQGQMAGEIKGLGDISYFLHKLAHAASGCVAGAIQNQCESGAIGAAIGEVVAENLLDGRNPTFISDQEKLKIENYSKLIAGTVSAYAGYDVNIAANSASIAIQNNALKDKALLQLEAGRKYLDDKSKALLDDLSNAYKKGDIKAAQNLKNQLDEAIGNWASSGSYEVLGVYPKALVGALVYAAGTLVIPTNVGEIIPIGKLSKAAKAIRMEDPKKLADELAMLQQVDIKIGTTLKGAQAPITVTAETNIGGKYMFDTNQTARPDIQRQNKPTLAAGGKVDSMNPNLTMKNAHAEVALIQRAYDAGLTSGQNMQILVRGQEVCSHCQEVMKTMYERSGLAQLVIHDTKQGTSTVYSRVNGKTVLQTTPIYGR